MNISQEFLLLGGAIISSIIGSVLGYYARQTIAKKQLGTAESKINQLLADAKKESQELLIKAKDRAVSILEEAKREDREARSRLINLQSRLEKREVILDRRLTDLDRKETDLAGNIEKVQSLKVNLEELKNQEVANLEKVAQLTREEAKNKIFERVEQDQELNILERMQKLERDGKERLERKAKEILGFAIQRYAAPQVAEITTTTVSLPSEEIKGRIIGKEGRNIKTLERMTGVEFIVDDAPEAVVISGFDPVRRYIAKNALEKLIADGRIHPARIEELVEKAKQEIVSKIKEMGEAAIFDAGIIGVDPKLTHLLGRLYFRTSYGQNVLLHSLEVCHLAGALASEIGADVATAKKAGLFHDIGKAVDHEIQGSHTDIGINILKRFKIEDGVINAMKSHHEEYPYETLEAIIVQSADAISGARPGARKDSLENYLKRLGDLEAIAVDFGGVEKAYAIQAGREVRIFVRPEEISDFAAQKLARSIADRIQEELKYPGEIKVNVIRETRVTEYAR